MKKTAIFAMTSALVLASCGQNGNRPDPTCNADQYLQNGVCVTKPADVTTGALNTPANPQGYTLTVRDAQGNVVPADQYGKLKPGNYTATYSKDGYVSQNQTFTIVAGQTVSLSYPTLQAVPAAPVASGAYYVNADGKMVGFTKEQLSNAAQNFVFFAWMEDKAGGINATDLSASQNSTEDERSDVAPVGNQNLSGAYVGFKAPDGKIYPVVGAGVRWDIVQDKSQTNVRFATADDGAIASGAIRPQDVNDSAMSATTFTNRSTANNARFPSSADYPLTNNLGVGTPDVDGFTWTALWAPNRQAGQAQISAVAEINGTEINKTVLTKVFAPSARLSVTKTATNNNVGLNQDGTFNVVVRNDGDGTATGIRLNDMLSGGANDAYSLTAPAGGTANDQDGFTATFDLAPGQERTFTFQARANAVGVYCDVASITEYTNGEFGLVRAAGTGEDWESDRACLTVTAPQLNIRKELVNADGTAYTGNTDQVARNQNVYARITVTNGGNAAANNVVVTDNLVSGNADNYALTSAVVAAPQQVAVTNNGNDGFTSGAFNLAAGASQTFTFPAAATADGTYCDAANMTATSNNGQALNGTTQNVCFTVVSPNLTINKFNTVRGGTAQQNVSLLPGGAYDSVITLANTGTGPATGVAVRDILGNLNAPYNTVDAGDRNVAFGSGSFTTTNGQTGSLTVNGTTVTTVPATVTLAPGESMTVRLTSSVPAALPAGDYCNFAEFTSTNAGTGNAQACITVRNTIAVATSMDDNVDPVAPGTQFRLTSSIAVEQGSNQAARNNVVNFNFGSTDPRATAPGVFNLDTTEVRYNPNPQRDPVTGAIQDPQAAFTSARVLTEGTDYTLSTNDGNQQIVTFNDQIGIGGVVYFVHTLNVPAGTADRDYNSGFVWNYVGVNNGVAGATSVAESTTVVTP